MCEKAQRGERFVVVRAKKAAVTLKMRLARNRNRGTHLAELETDELENDHEPSGNQARELRPEPAFA
jgi:hypothetical protein